MHKPEHTLSKTTISKSRGASPGYEHGRPLGPLLVNGVVDPHVFGHAVLRAPPPRDVHLAADGAGAELLPGAGQVGLGDDLLSFVVYLKAFPSG